MVTSARVFLTAALIAAPCLWATNVLADAPVTTLSAGSETVSSSAQADASTVKMSPEQRLRMLENKLQFLENAQVVQTLAQLRDRMQSLQGNLDVQSHDLQQLKKQQTDFYRDIDRRIAQLSGSKTNTKLTDVTAHPNEAAPVAAAAQANVSTAPSTAPAAIAVVPTKVVAPAPQAKEVAAQTAAKVIVNTSPSIAPAVRTTLSEQQAYEQAYRLIINHRFADATKALQQFNEQFPNSRYSANAHYWLGELYFHERDLANARQEFVLVTTQYPQNVKAADCLYKLGMIARLQNDLPTSRQYFQDILKRFPESKVATLAGPQLHRMA